MLFQLILTPNDGGNILIVNYTAPNNINNEFMNRLTVTGLDPNTEYSLVIHTVSPFQSMLSDPSTPVMFNTSSISKYIYLLL